MLKIIIILLFAAFSISNSKGIIYKIADLNDDLFNDTIIVTKISDSFMPHQIIWGNKDSLNLPPKKVTEFDYPVFKRGSFSIYDFNNDSLLDIYIFYIKVPKNEHEQDTIQERILYGQSDLDKQNKIEFHKIKDIQLNPFLALEVTEQRNKYDKKKRKSYGGISYMLKGLDIKPKEKKERIGEQSILSNNKVNIYPNPATDVLYIDVIDADKNNYTFKILNLTGISVYNEILSFSDKTSKCIDISALASGVYFLILESDELFYKSYKFQIIK